MIRIIENQARNDQIQMLTAETQMALREIRGVARIFPELRTFFSNLPPPSPPPPLPPNSKFDRQKHSHRRN